MTTQLDSEMECLSPVGTPKQETTTSTRDSFSWGSSLPTPTPEKPRKRRRCIELDAQRVLYVLRPGEVPIFPTSPTSSTFGVSLQSPAPAPRKRQVPTSEFKHDEEFHYCQLLGEGSFSKVFLAEDRTTGVEYAIKVSRHQFRGTCDRKLLLNEIETVQSVPDCVNVTKYYRAWQADGRLYTQMEYCPGGTLQMLLANQGALPLLLVQLYLRDILRGLDAIHTHGVIHLDIKPENIYMGKDNCLKIGDFGLAIRTNDKWHGDEGDKVYLAPEILQGNATCAADIFSTGLVLYQMGTGLCLPQTGEAWERLRCEGAAENLAKACPAPLRALVASMCAHDPKDRATARALLESPFLQ